MIEEFIDEVNSKYKSHIKYGKITNYIRQVGSSKRVSLSSIMIKYFYEKDFRIEDWESIHMKHDNAAGDYHDLLMDMYRYSEENNNINYNNTQEFRKRYYEIRQSYYGLMNPEYLLFSVYVLSFISFISIYALLILISICSAVRVIMLFF